MPRYFKPHEQPGSPNYMVTRKNRAGVWVRDQLPSEGVYTPHEVAQIREFIPGLWLTLKPGQTGYVFGLRKILKD